MHVELACEGRCDQMVGSCVCGQCRSAWSNGLVCQSVRNVLLKPPRSLLSTHRHRRPCPKGAFGIHYSADSAATIAKRFKETSPIEPKTMFRFFDVFLCVTHFGIPLHPAIGCRKRDHERWATVAAFVICQDEDALGRFKNVGFDTVWTFDRPGGPI